MIAFSLIVGLALAPARNGPMIVLPVSSIPVKPWLDSEPGATVLGLGLLPGSIIVKADRDTLFPVAIAHRAFLLPALPMLCGQSFPHPEVG